jgi:hypothetical protein
VTIYLSKAADNEGKCYKYDPVNRIWQDYSIYTKFSPNRQEVYLTLKDGGFGDADGIENGIIVDPLAFGSESDPKNDNSDSAIVFDKLENDKIKWKLTNGSEIVATLETLGLDFPESYGAVNEIKLGKDVIFKASKSGLNVEPSVAIGEDDWTESNVDKRRIDPGKTEALEVKFTDKGDRAGWLLIDPVGGVSFAENCAAEFPLVGGCALGNPTALVFEYTGAACDATTNDQEGKFKCEETGSSLGDLESVEMTKDANKISVAISGNKVTIFYDDPVGEKFPSEIKYKITDVDGNTQSQTLQTWCSKALNVGDQFGALTLGEFIPED